MIDKILKLKDKPLLVSIFGWLFFPGMYLLVGILTSLGTSVETAFIAASPAGVIGFTCWVAAFIFSLQHLVKRQRIPASIGGLVASLIPLAFLAYAFWIAVNGGV